MTHEKNDTSKKGAKSTHIGKRICSAEEDNKLLQNPGEVQEGLTILEQQRTLCLTSIKDSCKFELQRFINMRGKIDGETDKIYLPLMTVFDQNTTSTIKKIKEANDLIRSLDAANSVKEIKDILETSSSLGNDLDAVIGKCLVITGLLKSSSNVENKI